MSTNVLRLPQLLKKVGLSRSAIYAAISEQRFPPPVRLGIRAVGWLEEEVEAWVLQQVKNTRQ